MKNFTTTAAAILGLALLPVPAESACTLKNLQGRYVAMIAGEFSGFWQRCNLTVDGSGLATGTCLAATGDVGSLDPIQFSVRPNCSVSGNGASGLVLFAGRAKLLPFRRVLHSKALETMRAYLERRDELDPAAIHPTEGPPFRAPP